MIIKQADYVGSYPDVQKCPDTKMFEFAFIGRSNVGKSSLINYLTGRKKLSKVSVTPGKTQTINLFLINKEFHFVDLPGYGYARKSKAQRDQWLKMIIDYITKRKQLLYLCVLIDSRIPPQEIDLAFLRFLMEHQVPFIIIHTKADRPGAKENLINIQAFKNEMRQQQIELPHCFVTSSERKHGKEEVLQFFLETLHQAPSSSL